MEPDNFNQETPQVEQSSSLHKVTPLSKYLAMALFIILPFIGGYVGYTFAPEKIVEVEKVVTKEVEVEKITQPPAAEDNPIKFPVIAFERKGLLSDEDMRYLNTRFIEPYVDYYKMSGDGTVITTVIEVPQDQGEPYVINTVTIDGNAGGFLFGERGGEYDYWAPGCFGKCEFTDEYAAKYPEVISQYERNIQP